MDKKGVVIGEDRSGERGDRWVQPRGLGSWGRG